MKEKYKHLKLVIECPTLDAWDKITEFFGLVWESPSNLWNYQQQTYIRIGTWGRQQDSCGFGVQHTYIDFKDWEHLTYSQFEQRFLNKNTMKDKKLEGDELTPEQQIGFINLCEKIAGKTLDELGKKERVWTVKDVYKEQGMTYPNNKEMEVVLGKQVWAFSQLLTVAHWANGGEYLNQKSHVWYWQLGENQYWIPVALTDTDAKEKFLSVHGVEDLLKTFFGIE